MRSQDYIGKILNCEKLNNYKYFSLPDDFETPCYKVIVNDNSYEPKDWCFYSLYIHVDHENKINKIERDKDIYVTSYFQKRLPAILEKLADKILIDLTEGF